MVDDFLNEQTRAEDILLGALGFDSDARITSIKTSESGFTGTGVWSDGEEFDFESDDDLTELECWALDILKKEVGNAKKASTQNS